MQAPFLFLQHDKRIAVPDSEWTPFPWMLVRNIDNRSAWTDSKNAVSAVAAASNGAALPTGTITLDDARAFTPQGYAGFETDSGIETVVRYLNRTATQLLGCTLGTGTLATGDVARQLMVDLNPPPGTIGCIVVEHAWPNVVDPGGTALTRMRSSEPPFQLEAGSGPAAILSELYDETNAPARSIAIEQPGAPAFIFSGGSAKFRIEVWQNTGGTISTLRNPLSLGYPRLVEIPVIPFSI